VEIDVLSDNEGDDARVRKIVIKVDSLTIKGMLGIKNPLELYTKN